MLCLRCQGREPVPSFLSCCVICGELTQLAFVLSMYARRAGGTRRSHDAGLA